jgi:hypothetical protein
LVLRSAELKCNEKGGRKANEKFRMKNEEEEEVEQEETEATEEQNSKGKTRLEGLFSGDKLIYAAAHERVKT